MNVDFQTCRACLEVDSLIGVFGPRGMSSTLRESIADDIKAIVAADPTIATRLE
jgi:hypothetical protein